jgi:hypothetical protein
LKTIAFIDTEIEYDTGRVLDTGGIKENGSTLHSNRKADFIQFLNDIHYICGHNIINHDLVYLTDILQPEDTCREFIDTLFLPPPSRRTISIFSAISAGWPWTVRQTQWLFVRPVHSLGKTRFPSLRFLPHRIRQVLLQFLPLSSQTSFYDSLQPHRYLLHIAPKIISMLVLFCPDLYEI